jgi:hypothetical protein
MVAVNEAATHTWTAVIANELGGSVALQEGVAQRRYGSGASQPGIGLLRVARRPP